MISAYDTERLLRDALQQLHRRPASELPAVPYDHDGPHWAEWLVENLPAGIDPLCVKDARYLIGMLKLDIRTEITRGKLPSPELRATLLRWQHGPEDALYAFVQPAWARGEVPDDNVTWLLLHPDKVPANFPMFCEAY